jgi:tetratricopeptide (TPR) repeat protein
VPEAQAAVKLAEELNNDMLAWRAYRLLRSAYLSLNRRLEAEQLDREMQILAERMEDPHRAIELILTWFDELYNESPEIAINGAQTALTRAEELQDPVLEAECWSILADLYSRQNDLLSALDAYRQQISLLRQIGDRRHEGLTLNRIGLALIQLGQLSEGNNHLQDAYRILHQIGERSGEATSLVYLGIVAEHYKAHDEALAYMRRGLALQRALNADIDMILTLFHIGNVCIMKGQLDEAEKSLREACAGLDANGLSRRNGEISIALAEISFLRGDCNAAHEQIGKDMIERLAARDISDLYQPGLTYWRAIQVLEACDEIKQASALRTAFLEEATATLDKIAERSLRAAYVTNIWYHAALMNTPL